MSRYVLNDEQEALYRRSQRVIVPSKLGFEYWEGGYADATCPFSNEQLLRIAERGLVAETIDRVVVEAPGNPRRIYLPSAGRYGQEAVYFHRRLACPIIGHHGDRLKIIAPNGATKLVYPDGSLTRSKRSVA